MRRAAALLPTLLICLSLRAGDDLSYAQALADQGYFDLAREVCEHVRTDPLTPAEEKAAVDLALAGIFRREATVAKESYEARIGAINNARGLVQDFVAAHPAHARAPEARLLLGEIWRDYGRMEADAAKAQADPKVRAERAGGADACLTKAEECLQALVADLKQAGVPKENAVLLRASYYLPLVRCDRALAMAPGKDRDDLLAAAIKSMDEFRWAFDGFAAAYDLAISEGAAAAELKQYAKVVEALDSTIALQEAERIDETTRPLIFRAYWVKAKVLAAIDDAEAGKTYWPLARDAADRAEALAASAKDLARDKVIPDPAFLEDAESVRFRMLAIVEKARALSKMGETDGAIAAAQKAAAVEGPWQDEARALIAELAGGGDIPLPSRLALVEGSLRREDWTGVVEQARLVIDGCQGQPDMRKYGAAAWTKMGMGLQQLERYKEAAQAFEEAGRVYEVIGDPTPEEKEHAAECAYRAASCWGKQSATAHDPLDDAAYERAVKLLVDRFGTSPYAANAPYIVGDRLERQGKWTEAIAQYEKVAEGAEAQGLAITRICTCRYQIARQLWADAAKDPARKEALETQAREAFARAEEALRACLDRLRQKGGDAESVSSIVFLLASVLMHDAVGKYRDALPLLDEVEKGNPDRPEVLGKAKAYRVETLVCLAGNDPAGLAKAEEALDDLIRSVPDSPRIGISLHRVGRAYAMAAAAADAAAKPALARKAADRLRAWVETAAARGDAVKADDALIVVDYLLGLGEGQDLAGALHIAEAVSAGRFGKATEGEDAAAVRLARARVRMGKYAEAKEELERLRQARPKDAGVLADLAEAYLGLGRGGETAYIDRALGLLTELVSRAEIGSEPYWRGWWKLLETLYETGQYAAADAQMLSLEMRHPEFDGGRFGLAEKLKDLKRRIREKIK